MIGSPSTSMNGIDAYLNPTSPHRPGPLLSPEGAIHLAQVAQRSAPVRRGIGNVVGDHGLHPEPRHTTACADLQGRPSPADSHPAWAEQRRHRHLIQMDSPLAV